MASKGYKREKILQSRLRRSVNWLHLPRRIFKNEGREEWWRIEDTKKNFGGLLALIVSISEHIIASARGWSLLIAEQSNQSSFTGFDGTLAWNAIKGHAEIQDPKIIPSIGRHRHSLEIQKLDFGK